MQEGFSFPDKKFRATFYRQKAGRAYQLSAAALCVTLIPVVMGSLGSVYELALVHTDSNHMKPFRLKARREVCGALMFSEGLDVVKGHFPACLPLARLPCPAQEATGVCWRGRSIAHSPSLAYEPP